MSGGSGNGIGNLGALTGGLGLLGGNLAANKLFNTPDQQTASVTANPNPAFVTYASQISDLQKEQQRATSWNLLTGGMGDVSGSSPIATTAPSASVTGSANSAELLGS